MKAFRSITAVIFSLSLLYSCESGGGSNPQTTENGLVPVQLTKKSDTSAKVKISIDDKDIINGAVPIEFSAGADWSKVKTTHYVLKSLAVLIGQGKVKVIVAADGGVTFEPLK